MKLILITISIGLFKIVHSKVVFLSTPEYNIVRDSYHIKSIVGKSRTKTIFS